MSDQITRPPGTNPKINKLVFNNKRSKNGWVTVAVSPEVNGNWMYQTPAGADATPATESMEVAGDHVTTLPKYSNGNLYTISPTPFAQAQVWIYADPGMGNFAGPVYAKTNDQTASANAIVVKLIPKSNSPSCTMTLYFVDGQNFTEVGVGTADIASIDN